MFTFPCTTNQAKVFTFEGAFNFHKNLARKNKIRFENFDKAKKKDLTKNKSDEDKDQALEFATEGEKCTELREDMSLLKEFNFRISEITTKIKIPREWIGIAKEN